MIGFLAIVAYFVSVGFAFREVTRQPIREGLTMLAFSVMILLAVIAGNILTGGE